jgi:hypothetical protein
MPPASLTILWPQNWNDQEYNQPHTAEYWEYTGPDGVKVLNICTIISLKYWVLSPKTPVSYCQEEIYIFENLLWIMHHNTIWKIIGKCSCILSSYYCSQMWLQWDWNLLGVLHSGPSLWKAASRLDLKWLGWGHIGLVVAWVGESTWLHSTWFHT